MSLHDNRVPGMRQFAHTVGRNADTELAVFDLARYANNHERRAGGLG